MTAPTTKDEETATLDHAPPLELSPGDVETVELVKHEQAWTRRDIVHWWTVRLESGEKRTVWMNHVTFETAERNGEQVKIRCIGTHPVTGERLFDLERTERESD